jgi:hypothetical protein
MPRLERPGLLLPWVGLTLLLPANFVASIVLNLLLFNLTGVWWLMARWAGGRPV